MSRSESIADWSPSAASSVAPVLDGDQSACSPRECLNQFTRSTCPTNGDHLKVANCDLKFQKPLQSQTRHQPFKSKTGKFKIPKRRSNMKAKIKK